MAKRALADVLWEAANVWLPIDGRGYPNDLSCNALGRVFKPVGGYHADIPHPVMAFLFDLGCDVYRPGGAFSEHTAGFERQSARYVWLLLAAKVAEDEGIEVDA